MATFVTQNYSLSVCYARHGYENNEVHIFDAIKINSSRDPC